MTRDYGGAERRDAPTPRVDAEMGFVGNDAEFYKDKTMGLYVPVAFARILALEVAELRAVLTQFLEANDAFVRDTGLRHGDAITEAAERARAALAQGGDK